MGFFHALAVDQQANDHGINLGHILVDQVLHALFAHHALALEIGQ